MATALKLASGHSMPVLGLGTFLATKPGEVGAAVKAAIKAGYRLIDCAAGYGNQAEVGEAISEMIAEGVCTRSDLFIVSKLFQTHHVWDNDKSRCQETLDKTLKDLRLDYLDLFLIHCKASPRDKCLAGAASHQSFPSRVQTLTDCRVGGCESPCLGACRAGPFAFLEKKLEKPEGQPQPLRLPDGSPNPIWTIKMEYTQTWACLEEFVENGKVRSIGVSNFSRAQLEHLATVAKVPIAVNQIEVHPYLSQREMIQWCEQQGIRVMGYSPLGSSQDKSPPAHGCTLLAHPVVQQVAAKAGKTAAQVLIRWGLQRFPANFISIPKSSNAERIALNGAVLDWALSDEAMSVLDGLESGFRYLCVRRNKSPRGRGASVSSLRVLPPDRRRVCLTHLRRPHLLCPTHRECIRRRLTSSAPPRILPVSVCLSPPPVCVWRATPRSISYYKRPENDALWHGDTIETGTSADFVSKPPMSTL